MDDLAAALSHFLPNDVMPSLIGIMVASAVLFVTLVAIRGMQARVVVGRRLARGADGNPTATGAGGAAQRATVSVLQQASRIAMPTDQDQLSGIRKALFAAGYFSTTAPSIYYSLRVVSALGLPILCVICAGLFPQIPTIGWMIAASALSALGLVVPPIFLDWRTSQMKERYRSVFPDFMDLMVICVEAGQSLQGAIERVSREISASSPELGTNLNIVSLELRAGRDLQEALKGLSGRLGIDEVKSLTLLLKQSEELGTSLAGSLRVYSDEMRDKRLMRAEAKANALPVKMVVPLGVFMFPVILIVIMLPLVLRLTKVFV